MNVALNDKHSPLSCSIPSLSPSMNGSSVTETLAPPTSESNALLSPAEPGHDFLNGAQDLISRLTAGLRTLNHERERLKLVIETATETSSISSRNGAPAPGVGEIHAYHYFLTLPKLNIIYIFIYSS